MESIEKLLEKYFEAETTLQEEDQLKAYFTEEKIAPHLVQYVSLFGYFEQSKKELSPGLAFEIPARFRYVRWMSAAAVLIIGFSVYFNYRQNQQQKQAEKAYQQAKEALEILSANFNNGAKELAYLEMFEQTKAKIFE
ncbi:MAG: hypothetical protein CO119_01205 [Flavobacteriales bacterium CG_4_9_14_3_um_filter_40_17]|nr:MAG: hypothetical protein CO119_01205 [Flavobacteriales bacterium CG_4_9_14_3_um_filter_40_17]